MALPRSELQSELDRFQSVAVQEAQESRVNFIIPFKFTVQPNVSNKTRSLELLESWIQAFHANMAMHHPIIRVDAVWVVN